MGRFVLVSTAKQAREEVWRTSNTSDLPQKWNESIQEDVTQNVESVKEELGQVEVLMKGMKSDVLQYRYALEGMTEYSKELDTVGAVSLAVIA